MRFPFAPQPLTRPELLAFARSALAEDGGRGDLTTRYCVPARGRADARLVTRQPCVVAGVELAKLVFTLLSPRVRIGFQARDGDALPADGTILELSGPARALLTGERIALNFLQRMCGIATLTARFVRAVAGTKARIVDTRKTTPGLRRLEKYSVVCGGGWNHRSTLSELMMLKDNHLAWLASAKPERELSDAVRAMRRAYPDIPIEIEVDELSQLDRVLQAGPDIILLDNMKPATLRKAVGLIKSQSKTEASGGVTLETVRAVARTGVDFISVGALTHSAPAIDISLELTRAIP